MFTLYLKVKKALKNPLNNYKGFLRDLNTFTDILAISEPLLFKKVMVDTKMVSYALQWELGNAVLAKLYDILNVENFNNLLINIC